MARDGRAQQPFPQLTEREHEVLDHLARGLDNHAIAAALHLSGKTVANHVSTILAKLHLADRSQAIVHAREAGLGRRPEAPRTEGPGRVVSVRPGPGKAGRRTLLRSTTVRTGRKPP